MMSDFDHTSGALRYDVNATCPAYPSGFRLYFDVVLIKNCIDNLVNISSLPPPTVIAKCRVRILYVSAGGGRRKDGGGKDGGWRTERQT